MTNVLLGGCIGDALGMPFEMMLASNPVLVEWDGKTFLPSRPRPATYYGDHPQLNPGMMTDDGQMMCMVAESLVENSGFNPDDLSARYIDWIVSKRARGYGRTTLMAVQNLISGKHWSESGIAGSLGNGTAMRAGPFGIYFRDDLESLKYAVKIDSAITHVSPDAEAGALTIALAAAYAVNNDLDNVLEKIWEHLPDSKVKNSIYSLGALASINTITPQQALTILGTKANVQETVPAAMYCFLKFNNYYDAVMAAVRAGGDTDTTAAIVGALFGAKLGMSGIDSSFYAVEDFDKLVLLDSKLYNRSGKSFFPRD